MLIGQVVYVSVNEVFREVSAGEKEEAQGGGGRT